MNRKLGRLLRPGMGIYLLFMVAFPVAAFLRDDLALAALGLGAMYMAIGLYLILRERRS